MWAGSGETHEALDDDDGDGILDGDQDVDNGDLDVFLGCMSGAHVPADPACNEQPRSANRC